MEDYDKRMVIVLHIHWEKNMDTSVLLAEMKIRLNGVLEKSFLSVALVPTISRVSKLPFIRGFQENVFRHCFSFDC